MRSQTRVALECRAALLSASFTARNTWWRVSEGMGRGGICSGMSSRQRMPVLRKNVSAWVPR